MNTTREMDRRAPRQVLVIDDNVDLALSLAGLLQFYNCRVDVAHDGREGLRMALRNPYDVVFIDIGLPILSGYEVARVIRNALDEPPVLLAQTAYGQPEDARMSREAGFDAHLVKPVDPGVLVRHVLEGRDAISNVKERKTSAGGATGVESEPSGLRTRGSPRSAPFRPKAKSRHTLPGGEWRSNAG